MAIKNSHVRQDWVSVRMSGAGECGMVRPSLGHLAFIKTGLVFLGRHHFALALAQAK